MICVNIPKIIVKKKSLSVSQRNTTLKKLNEYFAAYYRLTLGFFFFAEVAFEVLSMCNLMIFLRKFKEFFEKKFMKSHADKN